MKRRIIVSLGFLLIILSGIFTFILLSDETHITENNKTQFKEENQDRQFSEEETDREEEGEIVNETEEEKNPEDKVKDIILDVVQHTIDFFTNKELNIVAVGDSLTQGVGASENSGGYVGMIEQSINNDKKHAHIQNFGKSGDRTDQLLVRLDDPKVATAISEADIVLITIGANDIMQVVKENFIHLTYNRFADARFGYEEHLQDVFDRIESLNDETDIYLIGFYNPFATYFPDIEELGMIVDDWNAVGEKLVKDYPNATYIPTKDLFVDETIELLAEDHFHPNDRGYKRIARRVLNYITEEEG